MNKLNLGSGTDYREGWINVDVVKEFNPDITFDINKIYNGEKLPFPDNHFDYILLQDVLEHFPEPLPIIWELYRVCNKGGRIEIAVPMGSWVWDNLDHKRQFNKGSLDCKNFGYGYHQNMNVKIIKKEIYVLPSRNIIFHIARKLFKKNLRVIYEKRGKND